MKIKVVVHEAEEGGYWAEVPAIPGCASQGETMEELLKNVREAIEGCLSVDVKEPEATNKGQVLEIALSRRFPGKNLRKLSKVTAGSSCEFMAAITFTESLTTLPAFPYPFTATSL